MEDNKNQEQVQPWPKSPNELAAAGFTFMETKTCRGVTCDATIQWWKTPNNKLMPLTRANKGELDIEEVRAQGGAMLQPHWVDCPDAPQFKAKKEPKAKFRPIAERLRDAEAAIAVSESDRRNLMLLVCCIMETYHRGTIMLPQNAMLKYSGAKVRLDMKTTDGGQIVLAVNRDGGDAPALVLPGDIRFGQTLKHIKPV